jgi:hypothetical protein
MRSFSNFLIDPTDILFCDIASLSLVTEDSIPIVQLPSQFSERFRSQIQERPWN